MTQNIVQRISEETQMSTHELLALHAKNSKNILREDDSDYVKSVAHEIAKQLGNQTFSMLGAKNLVAGKNFGNGYPFLAFKIQGSRKVNYIKIEYNSGEDMYNIVFQKGFDLVKRLDRVFFDQLHDLIESYTGLYTTLFPRN